MLAYDSERWLDCDGTRGRPLPPSWVAIGIRGGGTQTHLRGSTPGKGTMTRRALLIGCETYGLGGCNADVALVRDVLARLEFGDCVQLTGPDASRQGILEGYERLIDATDSEDAVVVYYSGHGGRVALPDWEERQAKGEEAFLQYIVPHDMEQTTPSDFRGVLSRELSALQARLTAQTRNVTPWSSGVAPSGGVAASAAEVMNANAIAMRSITSL